MEIHIYQDNRGKPCVAVTVYNSTKDSAKQIARVYKEVMAELAKKEEDSANRKGLLRSVR